MTSGLDSLVARGNTSDVFQWGRHAVVKVLRPGIPDEWADREAETGRLVHAAGLPAPEVLDVIELGGRPAIVFERIDGMPMWSHMLDRPSDIARLSGLLAALQAEISATPAPSRLSSLHARLRPKIAQAGALSPAEQLIAESELECRPPDRQLVHFDMHPNNVLLSQSGPVVIDWYDAAAGSPTADVVRSSVLMRKNAAQCHLPCPDPTVISEVHDRYLKAVLEIRDVADQDLRAWARIVLAARAAEPVGDAARHDAVSEFRAISASAATQLDDAVRHARLSDAASA